MLLIVTTLLCVAFCVQIQRQSGIQLRAVNSSVCFALYQPCDAYMVGFKWLVRGV